MAESGNASGTDLQVSFAVHPKTYKHWKLSVDGEVATLAMDVDEEGGIGDYVLKQNSYDLGVDVELWDAVNRIRFEHPEAKSVVVTGLKDKVFCAGANIFMLGASSHAFKVNFCKFTNETRLGMEDASTHSGLKFLAALNGTAAGGGYELALACDEILLLDDANSAVSFPEVPLLGVLPGTGGLTRITDKRKMRRDLCDVFSTAAEGVKGKRAVEWKLVDHLAPKSKWADTVKEKATALAKTSTRPGLSAAGQGVQLQPIDVKQDGTAFTYKYVTMIVDPQRRTASLEVRGPLEREPHGAQTMRSRGSDLWTLRCFRELDDAILKLRMNHLQIGAVTLKTSGDAAFVLEAEQGLLDAVAQKDWFAIEVLGHMRRVLKRVDVTAKTFLGLVEPGSCFTGCLAELLLLCDRSYMLDDSGAEKPNVIQLSSMNAGPLPMGNGLTRIETRYYGDVSSQQKLLATTGTAIGVDLVEKLGVVTFVRDDIDYPDEVRLFLEERASLSPDALTGMEANLRWPGPETMETRIFGRLSAWQNWIFTRPNATGEKGALTLYGRPDRPTFDMRRT
jgi:benzoyl-CoA-dihydrodiol lyase